jgi:hypothetical protein
MYDGDIYKKPYTNSENSYEIRQSNWDYGRSEIFGNVNGTLSMNMVLFNTMDKELNLKNNEDFLNALKIDLKITHNKQEREEYSINLPEKYESKTISGIH